MFAPGEDTFPGIIDIHGLGGGLLEPRASLLANHGFATLALAYYQFEDLPQKPKELHLEYFEEAVNYMLQHPQVGTLVFLLGSRNSSCKALSLCPSHLWRKLQKYSPGRAGLSKDFGHLKIRKRQGQVYMQWQQGGETSQSNVPRDRSDETRWEVHAGESLPELPPNVVL